MTQPGEPPTTPDPGGPPPAGTPIGTAGDVPLVPPSLPARPAAQAQQPAPAAHPYAAPPWPPPAAPAHGGWAPQPQLPQYPPAQYAPPAGQDPTDALRRARTALGWAIGAAVGAFLAMGLAVVALLAGSDLEEDLFFESLRGEVVGLPEGSVLSGDRLERPLVDLLLDHGADVEAVQCPDTASVTVSTAVVCTGEVDGFRWTGVVYFEDTGGRFVVLEL